MRDVVVVLNFNGLRDTTRCVESLLAGSPGAEIIVVDNGSDESIEPLLTRWPDLMLLRNERNLGFAGGMNRGLRHALAAGARTVTVLNNDTIVPQGAVQRLADIARLGQAVSPEVVYAGDRDTLWFGGGIIDPNTKLAHHVPGAELAPPGDDGLRESQVLAGACITASAETWRQVGLFDERYFLNFEDSDWSVRASTVGIRLVVDTKVRIRHVVSASFTGAYSYLGLYYYTRNGLLFGRERCGRTARGSLRFLRAHVAPAIRSPLRQRQWLEALRRTMIVGAALLDHLRRAYGQAGATLEQKCRAWATP